MFMNELPLAAPPLKTIGLAYKCALRISVLEHDIDSLNCANNSHVAVYHDVFFEDVDIARGEPAEYAVEHPQRRLDAPRGKSRDVEPKSVIRPMLRALCTGHGFSHFLDDAGENSLVALLLVGGVRHGDFLFHFALGLVSIPTPDTIHSSKDGVEEHKE
jgi:hypothetical protein